MLQGIAVALLAIIIVVGVEMAIWAKVTRSVWQLRNAIYFVLCGIGLTSVWFAFNIVIGPDLILMAASFLAVGWLSLLAKQTFNP